MARLWIDVHDASTDDKVGAGPITTATEWSYAPTLDEAGTFSFTMPAGDSRAALLTNKRIVRAWMEDGGSIRQVGAGIVDKVALDVADPTMLRVSGPDLMAELMGRVIPELAVRGQDWLYLNDTHGSVRRVPNLRNKDEEDLPEAYDGNTGTATDEFEIRDDWWLYIGYDTRFDQIDVDLATTNDTFTATPQYQYFNSSDAWADLGGVSDGTIDAGRPFAKDGQISFTRPTDWKRVTPTEAAGSWFWVRIRRTPDIGNNFTISLNEIKVYADVPTMDGVNLIMAYAPDTWTRSGYAATATAKYLEIENESVLAALRSLIAQVGQDGDTLTREHFRLGTGRELEWLSAFTDSGLRAVSAADAEGDDTACLITALRQERDTSEVITRIYPLSNDGIGLALTTRSAPTGYTLSTADQYLEYDAGISAYGQIDAAVRFTDISCQQGDSWYLHPAYVANAVYDRALEYLRTHASQQYFYDLDLVKVRAELEPGDTIYVSYHEYRDGYHAVNIDATLYVLTARLQVDQDGLHTVGLEVSTIDRSAQTDSGVVCATIQDVRRVVGSGSETRVLLGATGISTLTPGADIAIDGRVVSRAGNRVLLFHGDGAPVAEYLGDTDGMAAALTAALAAATDGDVIQLPAGTIPGDHTIPAGVEVVGRGRANTVLSGQITLSDGAVLRDLRQERTADQAGDLIGIVAPASGMAYVVGCNIEVNNAAGDGYACYGDLEHLTLRWCAVSAQSAGADSNPFGGISGNETVYFDASDDGPNDPDSHWDADANAFDGNEASAAVDPNQTEQGSDSQYYLHAAGTSSPGGGVGGIDQVRVRCRYSTDAMSPDYRRGLSGKVYTTGLGETLVSFGPLKSNGATVWSDYYTLDAPSGGWTWDALGALEIKLWADGSLTPSSGFVYVYRIETDVTYSDTVTPYLQACTIPNADGRAAAIPEYGDRASWRTDVDDGATHADDWDAGDSHHAAVTLGDAADVVLALTGQQLNLDTQAANTVLAGPASGADATPTFRALAAADLGTGTPDGSQYLRDDLTWQEITTVAKASDLTSHYEPLTNGDSAAPELLFTPDGDVIMVEVNH